MGVYGRCVDEISEIIWDSRWAPGYFKSGILLVKCGIVNFHGHGIEERNEFMTNIAFQ